MTESEKDVIRYERTRMSTRQIALRHGITRAYVSLVLNSVPDEEKRTREEAFSLDEYVMLPIPPDLVDDTQHTWQHTKTLDQLSAAGRRAAQARWAGHTAKRPNQQTSTRYRSSN